MFRKFIEKVDMYDTMLSYMISKDIILDNNDIIDRDSIYIGYNYMETQDSITRYFIIKKIPNYLDYHLVDVIRSECLYDGIKINAITYTEPYKIPWNSEEMKSRLRIWKKALSEGTDDADAFNFRESFDANNRKDAIAQSTLYFNIAELKHKRTVSKVSLIFAFNCKNTREGKMNLGSAIQDFKSYCDINDIAVKDISLNGIDWYKHMSMFKTSIVPIVAKQFNKFTVTDDVLAQFSSYKQGRIGYTGINMGMDIVSGAPVLKKFKENPDSAENMIIAAETGGGKSMTVKDKIPQFLAEGMTVTVMDYEGDEYTNLAAYLANCDENYVKVISMGKGSSMYFEPLEIAMLTGEKEIDEELKNQAVEYTVAYFRLMVDNADGNLTRSQDRVISQAIKNIYDSVGVTSDKDTWIKSKGLRIGMVYEELKRLKESGELFDKQDTTNSKIQAVTEIIDACYTYFEVGQAKYDTFLNPLNLTELCKSKFIVFQFGMKGAVASQSDSITLALKQLSVANISIQISNYCKYVLKCFNVKIWEEFQRWGKIKGSSEIIVNAMTGGRKRGDINILVTNDIADMLDDTNTVSATLTQNINIKMIGGIADINVRKKACERFGITEVSRVLERISIANQTSSAKNLGRYGKARKNKQSHYRFAFCLVMGTDKAFVKVKLHDSILESTLFRTGVTVRGD